MAPKRKRGIATNSANTTSRKRPKLTKRDFPEHPHGSFDPDREYKVRTILQEKKTQFLIDWEDDEVTGEKFDPTWEPKANVNAQAISDWERQKASRKQSRPGSAARRTSAAASVANGEPCTPAKRRRGKPRKVVLSSPGDGPSSSARAGPPPPSPPGAQQQQQLEINESQDTGPVPAQFDDNPEESLFLPEATPPINVPSQDHVTVQPSDPPSSFVNYTIFDSSHFLTGTAPEKEKSPEPSQYQPDLIDTSKTTEGTTEISAVATTQSQEPRSVPVNFESQSVRVVPDSQSLPDSSSFEPSLTDNNSASSSGNQVGSQLHEELQGAEGSQLADDQITQVPNTSSGREARINADESVLVGDEQIEESQRQQDPQPELLNQITDQEDKRLGELQEFTEHTEVEQQTNHTSQSKSAPVAGDQTESQPLPRQSQTALQLDHPSQSQAIRGQEAQSQSGLREPEPHPQTLEASQNGTAEENEHQPPASLASQPGAITITSGVTPSTNEFQFSSQVNIQESFQPRQQSQPVRPQQDQSLGSSVDQSNPDTSFPFETQVGRHQPLQTESNGIQQPPQSQPVIGSERASRNLSGFTPKAQSVPAEDTSPYLASSLIPSVPSHSVPLLGESAPPRPATPSTPGRLPSSTASSVRPSTMDPRALRSAEELQATFTNYRVQKAAERAQRRGQTPSAASVQNTPSKPSAVPARLNAEIAAESPSRLASPEPARDRARSPSAVPAAQPVHAATQEEMNTSERYGTLLPQEQDKSMLRRQSTITGSSPKPDATAKNQIYAVPVALVGLQRDTYQSEINRHRQVIERFLVSSQFDEDLTSQIDTLLDRLHRILVHPDLVNPEAITQYDVDPETHADWAVSCSAKFRFLKQLIGQLREREVSIAVFAEMGQLLQLLETFLTGLKFNWERVDTGKSQKDFEDCALTINIVPLREDVSTDSLSADIVVELEHDASATNSVMKLLQDKTGENPPLLMTLAVPNTLEHVERCLSPNLPRVHKLRSLVHAIFDLRFDAGKLEESQLPSTEAITAIVEFFANSSVEKEWPLATLSVLENLDSQTESELEPPATDETARLGNKRPHDGDNAGLANFDSLKRARRDQPNTTDAPDLPMTINPLDIEITRVSDSAPKPTQPEESAFNTYSSADPTTYLSPTEQRLQTLLHDTQSRLAEIEQDLSALQFRHEDQRASLVEVTAERDEAIVTAQRAVDRMSENAATLSALRQERTDLQSRLDSATAALADHSVPERAELETLRQHLATAQAEREKSEARLKVQQGDLDYAQEMYRASSTSAQSFASQTTELENSVAVLRNAASGHQTQARLLTLDSRSQLLQRENKQLKVRLRDMEKLLGAKEEEVKNAGRGRVGTRAGSMPRSPRLGSPRKAGPRSRQGSRQGSPAAGELRGKGGGLGHPLRQQG